MTPASIKTKAQYEWAVKRVEDLLPFVDDDTNADAPERIELELLSNMVADYSDEHFALGAPSLADIIRLRMYEMGLNTKALSALLEVSTSRLRNMLAGRTEPSLAVARNISLRLGVDPGVVLGV